MSLTPPLKWHGKATLIHEFRLIPGFTGYRVGADGNLWSCRRSTGGRIRTQALSDEWKKLKPDTREEDGRKRYTLKADDGTYRRHYGSYFVLLAFVGPRPEGTEACHKNGVCTDDSAGNLRWDTPTANKADMVAHGTRQCGEQINTAKLDADAVREIRQAGKPLRPHAEKYGVTPALISAILKRKVWKHV